MMLGCVGVSSPTIQFSISDSTTMGTEWTDAEDKLLEAGLSKYPASLEKNERWSAIARGVPGRSKKECVQRFRAIREALKEAGSAGGTGASSFSSDVAAKKVAGGSSEGAGEGAGALLIPSQAVDRENHRRASGGGGGDRDGEERRGDATPIAALDAGAAEFVPPTEADTAKHATAGREDTGRATADGSKKKSGKTRGSRGRGRGKKAPTSMAGEQKEMAASHNGVNKSNVPSKQSAINNGAEKDQAIKQQQENNTKGKKKKKGAKAVEISSAADQGSEAKKKNKARKKRPAKKKKDGRKGKFAWRNEIPAGAVDPISLDPLIDLPYPPFALVATEPYDVISEWPVPEEEERRMELMRDAAKAGADGGEEEKRRIAERELEVIRNQWGDAVAASASAFSEQHVTDGNGGMPAKSAESDEDKLAAETGRRYYHLFDGRVLAYYLVSQLQFIDPLNRRDLTRPELVNLDSYLERHNLGQAGVTEAYDSRGLSVSAAGVAGQSVEGRAEILQQEARTLLGSLFSGDSHADGSAAAHRQLEARARAAPSFQNEFERHYVESERRQQPGERGGTSAGASAATERAQDAGVYAAEEGGILVIDDDVNPGLRGGLDSASESAQRHQRRTGRGEGGDAEPSTAQQTLWSASHIADRFGHSSRVRANNFPALQPSAADDSQFSSTPTQKSEAPQAPAKPSQSLRSMAKMVKKTDPTEAARQKRATEEARKKAALASLSFRVPGASAIDAAASDAQAVASLGVGSSAAHEATKGQLERNRGLATALGVQPATMRFNAGWARPTVANIELDEFGNELGTAQYPDALIIEARERMVELLKLEKRWKAFLVDDKAASHPLRAMPRDLRKFVHEYSDFWNLHTESFDPEPKRYIHCAKLKDTAVPHSLLSEAAKTWRGPGTGAPALPNKPVPSISHQQQSAGQSTMAREFPTTEERVPLRLEPRSLPTGFVPTSMVAPPGAMFDSDSVPKVHGEDGEDRQPAERFSSLLAERERSKLNLAPRTKPLELPPYQPQETKGYDIAKARERMERERKEKQEKQRRKEETAKNILADAFASSSDDDSDSISGDSSSDWGEEQDAAFSESDSE